MTGRERSASAALVWTALATVYVVWGSTYLAIRVAIDTLPPLSMAGVRFLIAGGLLYAWAIRRGDRQGDRPTAAHWRSAFIIGTALLLGGNGAVVLAEQSVASGIVALIVASVPLWMAAMAFGLFRERLPLAVVLGLGVGFGGVALLVGQGGRLDATGIGLAVFASVSWAAGSLYSRNAPLPRRPLVGTAMQMLAGGAVLFAAGAVTGELGRFSLAAVSAGSLLAMGYLVVMGSLVGFTAYIWLLRNTPTSLASTYAYVNPVVAVLLGWAFLSEPVTVRTLVAGAVIVAGVALIITARGPKPLEEAAPGEPCVGCPPVEDELAAAAAESDLASA